MDRDLSIDYAKGIAILFVYLGHSVIYHPIDLASMYNWCYVLERMITSFNMPMFFIISGILYGYSKKDAITIIKDKAKRLIIPYLVVSCIILISKYFLPNKLSLHAFSGWDSLWNVLFQGGDRWFVYVLMVIFIITLPFRRVAKTKMVFILITLCTLLSLFHFMPNIFLLNKVIYYVVFFFLGMFVSQYYGFIKKFTINNISIILALFVILNIFLIKIMQGVTPVRDYILPVIGSSLFIGIAALLVNNNGENKNILINYIGYCGRYSLQFYLLTFAYPIIRSVVVKYFSNPMIIVLLVFLLQLVVITLIIEFTRRVKILKIPFGY